jgi:penicillin-binding protein 1A
VQVAAETYFGKDVENLNLAEIAVLAGLPKAQTAIRP